MVAMNSSARYNKTFWAKAWRLIDQHPHVCKLCHRGGEVVRLVLDDDGGPAMGCRECFPDARQVRYNRRLAERRTGKLSVFSGDQIDVDLEVHHEMGELFPAVDRYSEYRAMESWLRTNPRRRPQQVRRFIHNWFRKAAEALRLAQGELERKEAERRREIDVGRNDY